MKIKTKKERWLIGLGVSILIVISILTIKILTKKEIEDISAWVVDWDLERGLTEVALGKESLDSLQVFAAYFNEKDEVFLPENLLDIDSYIKERGQEAYLTVVNDVIKENGESMQKDSALVTRLIEDEEARQQHISSLIKLVERTDFTGVELDYEKIGHELWEEYGIFIDKLGKELSKLDKKLRIVLEPSSPIEEIQLPQEYEYVMMAYNLYGYHSGPGPKADQSFIQQLSRKTKKSFKNCRVAFSLGGFDWAEDGQVRAVTATQIEELLVNIEGERLRDEESDALSFIYKDELGKKHEVWYADEETIQTWIQTAYSQGVNKFAIWRLGGNT